MPTDRVFFDYNHFGSAALTNDGRIIDVNRYTFGVEKTFLMERARSIPLAIVSGLAANQIDPCQEPTTTKARYAGNISITPKYLIAKSDTFGHQLA